MKQSIYLVAMLALFSPLASAHVLLHPDSSVLGERTYQVSAPNERNVSFNAVTLEIPAGVFVTGIHPEAGWTYALKTQTVPQVTTADGDSLGTQRITQIQWTNGSIQPGEYALFDISTYYSGNAATLAWNAHQTYSDGVVVDWADKDPDHPAPEVTLANQTPQDALVNSVNALDAKVAELQSKPAGSREVQPLSDFMPVAFSGIAVLVSVAALALSLKKKR